MPSDIQLAAKSHGTVAGTMILPMTCQRLAPVDSGRCRSYHPWAVMPRRFGLAFDNARENPLLMIVMLVLIGPLCRIGVR